MTGCSGMTTPKSSRPPFVRKPPEQRAYILAALIHPEDLLPFHRLRSRFFPGHRNFLSAHVTLLHYVRPEIREDFLAAVRRTVRRNAPAGTDHIPLRVDPPFSMGKGVAYGVEAAPLIALRDPLRFQFERHLKEQDLRPWKRPHITVQNKVEKEEARRLARHLQYRFEPCTLRLEGLTVYRYDYGPWTLVEDVRFTTNHS